VVDDGELLALVERTADGSTFSGVVDVRRGDEVIVSFAAGMADRRHRIPMTPSTRLAIASGTKGFTALTVMSLVTDGTLDLDARVRTLLGGDLPAIDDDVTVRHLLAHRSGIGDYLDEGAGGDIDDYVMTVPVHELASAEAYLAVLDGHPQRERPDELFRYNNSGYVVLAIIAERAAGQSYHDLVHQRVVLPAGLTATSFERGDELPADVAVGYLGAEGLRTNVLHLPVIGVGDGGIVVDASDLHRLWQAFFDDRIVPGDARRSMVAPISTRPEGRERYGLGFWLHPTSDVVELQGMDAGVSFWSVHDPEVSLTVTVVSNTSSGAWPVARAMEGALELD